MSQQISAGAVIFRRESDGTVKFLLLYHGKNYWNFPKGKLESGEKAIAAFLREVKEETGLGGQDLKILSDFRATDRYVFFAAPAKQLARPARQAVFKIVIFYLVEAKKRNISVSDEHEGYGWFTYPEAMRLAKFRNTREIITRAYDFIRKGVPRRPKHPRRKGRHVR